MSDTADRLRKLVDADPLDWDLREILADALDEDGQYVEAAFQRWYAAHRYRATGGGWSYPTPPKVNTWEDYFRSQGTWIDGRVGLLLRRKSDVYRERAEKVWRKDWMDPAVSVYRVWLAFQDAWQEGWRPEDEVRSDGAQAARAES